MPFELPPLDCISNSSLNNLHRHLDDVNREIHDVGDNHAESGDQHMEFSHPALAELVSPPPPTSSEVPRVEGEFMDSGESCSASRHRRIEVRHQIESMSMDV
jgi:hypothetical protein